MPKVYAAQGLLWKVNSGERRAVTEVDVPEFKDCCKLDCCNGGLYLFDIATQETRVIYIENGQLKQDTTDVFETAVNSYK